MSSDPPPCNVEPTEPDIGYAFRAAHDLIGSYVAKPTESQMGLLSIAILAAGAMVARAIYEFDATYRRQHWRK